MSIGFYFACQGRTIQLPVNPARLQVVREGNNRRAEIAELGDVSILRDPGLSKIDLEFFLPGGNALHLTEGAKRPEEYVLFFQRAMKSRKAVRFVVSELGVNMKMSVERFETTREAGDHESIACSLSLLQYRSYGAQVLGDGPYQSQFSTGAGAKRPVEKEAVRTHTVKPGESFWAIARRELGDGNRYREIASLNNLSAASIIHPGQVLKIPGR